MLRQCRRGYRPNGGWARCPGSGACGQRPLSCSQRACPLPRDSQRRRSRCRSWCDTAARAVGLAVPAISTCRGSRAAAGDSMPDPTRPGYCWPAPGDCRWPGGCCVSRARPAESGSGLRSAASTGAVRADCGRQSPQGGHELLASAGVATCITQKPANPPVRGELRFGFRVYSAGDMGAVPTGLPTGALR